MDGETSRQHVILVPLFRKRMSKNYIYRVQKDTGEKVFAGARALNARPVTEDARTRHAEQTGIYRGNMRGVS